MLGFAQYSPAVVALLLDRSRFLPFVVSNTSESLRSKLEDFLGASSERVKVLLFANVAILSEFAEQYKFQETKIIIFDLARTLAVLKLDERDVQIHAEGTFQVTTYTPVMLNIAVENCTFGIPAGGLQVEEEPAEKAGAQIIRNTLSGNGNSELGKIINSLIAGLGNREKYLATEMFIKFTLGMLSKRQLRAQCSDYSLDLTEVLKIVAFASDVKGKALRVAYMDVNLYSTDASVAIAEARANRADYDFAVALLDPKKDYEYIVTVPKNLVRKRKLLESTGVIEVPLEQVKGEEPVEGAQPSEAQETVEKTPAGSVEP